jgi:hypothetical protein
MLPTAKKESASSLDFVNNILVEISMIFNTPSRAVSVKCGMYWVKTATFVAHISDIPDVGNLFGFRMPMIASGSFRDFFGL